MLTRIARLFRGQEGFTLIELLVVVAIIALLATFAAPRLFDAITKAKEAPGQADLQTIASALDRYYFDKNAYPTGTEGLDKLITDGYLKSTVTFKNGFKLGYYYGAPADGGAYIVIDPKSVTTVQTDVCTETGVNWTPGATAGKGVITKAKIDTCNAPTGMAIVKY